MARLTILIGVLLTAWGVVLYAVLAVRNGESPSPTTLIPAFAGLPLLLLGCIALRESARKHAMHGVAMLSLLALLVPLGRLAMQLAKGAEIKSTALVSLLLMAGLSGFLLAACVRSFVVARLKSSRAGS